MLTGGRALLFNISTLSAQGVVRIQLDRQHVKLECLTPFPPPLSTWCVALGCVLLCWDTRP